MHLDEGSGWYPGCFNNHSLNERLLELARDHEDVRNYMVEAPWRRSGWARTSRTTVVSLRPCFCEDPPKFPTGEELYRIGRTAAFACKMHKGDSKRAQERREKTETSLKEAMAELERAAKFRGAVLAQRAQKRERMGEEPPSQQAKRQRSA